MQDGSNRWDDAGQDLNFLAATSVAGVLVSGLVMAGWWSLTAASPVAATDVVNQGVHNLSPDECRTTLNTALGEFRSDPRVLWVWVEESVPARINHPVMTVHTVATREAPRPYAFRPDVAAAPAGVCGFAWNSLHALSLGGVAGPLMEPAPSPWQVGVGP